VSYDALRIPDTRRAPYEKSVFDELHASSKPQLLQTFANTEPIVDAVDYPTRW